MVDKELFLNKKSLKEAKRIWEGFISSLNYPDFLGTEEIDVINAENRVSALEIKSRLSSPFYTASAVDGIAVQTAATEGASVSNPKLLKIGRDGILVNTGDPIPVKFNAVIMIENVEIMNDKFRILSPIAPYKNVRLIGEDIGVGETIVFPNEKITPAHIGVLLAGGINRIIVYKKPKVLVIPTGEEIKKPGDKIKIGDIIDTNSYMLKSFVEHYGGNAFISEVLPNNEKIISQFVKNNIDNFNMAIIIGGSAKGTKDLTLQVYRKIGNIFLHGVSIQPGKPVILAEVKNKPAMGMPGFPVSSFIAAHLFLKTAITHMQGIKEEKPQFIRAVVKRSIASSIGTTEFVRVKVGKVENKLVAVPLKKGAGVLSSVSNADGLLKIDFDKEGIESGERVKIELLRSKLSVRNEILFIGSNDPLLNFLFSFVKKLNPSFNFGIINSGSLAGLLALERGECSITAAHLFDSKTRTYNEPFFKKYVSKNIRVFHFSLREQGLILQKGNPKRIKNIKDLSRKDVTFVNRQKGSGTRVMLDYLLTQNNIDHNSVNGYKHEEYTHLAVANNVKLGGADCGMGIRYVADFLGLDFVPVKEEQYDLVILEHELRRKEVKMILNAMQNKEFIKMAKQFKGYKYVEGHDEEIK